MSSELLVEVSEGSTMTAGEPRRKAVPLSEGAARFGARVEQLAATIGRYQQGADAVPEDLEGLVGDLHDAYEELRVADEEIRAQHDQIAHLLEGRHLMTWQHERLLAVLPVPVLTTDLTGMIRSVNAAGAWLAERRVARMIGKPIFALFPTDDRPRLRQALARQVRDRDSFRETASVHHDDGADTKVEIMATMSSEDRVSWMLLTPS